MQQAGDLAAAIAAFRDLAQQHPEDWGVTLQLISALHAAKDMSGAEAVCRAYLSSFPDDALANMCLGDLLQRQGRAREAAGYFHRSARFAPDDPRPQHHLARCLQMAHRLGQLKPKRACLYTAIFGEYDHVRAPVRQDIDCDYVLFTDRPLASQDTGLWKVVVLDTADLFPNHPRLAAKFFKIVAHRAFALLSALHAGAGLHAYEQIIWVDGSIQITSEQFARRMLESISANGLAMLNHPYRRCIYREAEASLKMTKYTKQPLMEQVAHYRAQGYPEKNGLMACTVFARLQRPDVNRIFEDWWEENLRWSFQDQLSLPYVLWKRRRWFDPVDLSLLENPLFVWDSAQRTMSNKIR